MATTVLTRTQTIHQETDDSYESLQLSRSQNSRETRPPTLFSDNYGLDDSTHDAQNELSRARAVILIATLTGITFVGSMSTGLMTVSLPSMAADLNLPANLLLW